MNLVLSSNGTYDKVYLISILEGIENIEDFLYMTI